MKNFKKVLSFALAVGMVLSITACSSSGSGNTSSDTQSRSDSGNQKKYEFTMGSPYDAKAPVCIAAEQFVKDVKEKTNGAVTINFFTNETIGKEKEQLTAVAGNELEFTLSGMYPVEMYAPEYGFFVTPFLFKDTEHLKTLMESDLGAELKNKFLANNTNLIGIAYRGVRNMTSDVPIHTPEDLKGLKMRMTESPSWVAVWGKLGATTIPIALGELYTSLQTGVVEASEGPYEQFYNYKLSEVQKYLINTNHVYDWCGIYASESMLQSLPEEYAKIIKDSAKAAMENGTKLSQESAETFHKQLLDSGMSDIDVDPSIFGDKVIDVYKQFFKDTWTAATYEEVMNYAE